MKTIYTVLFFALFGLVMGFQSCCECNEPNRYLHLAIDSTDNGYSFNDLDTIIVKTLLIDKTVCWDTLITTVNQKDISACNVEYYGRSNYISLFVFHDFGVATDSIQLAFANKIFWFSNFYYEKLEEGSCGCLAHYNPKAQCNGKDLNVSEYGEAIFNKSFE